MKHPADCAFKILGQVLILDAGDVYICPMDPDVRSNSPGKCARCGMALVAGLPDPVEYHLHLEVAPEMTVAEAHGLARQLVVELKVKFPEVSDVIIHIEPRASTS